MEVAGLSHCGGVTVVRVSGLSEMTPRISITGTRKTAWENCCTWMPVETLKTPFIWPCLFSRLVTSAHGL